MSVEADDDVFPMSDFGQYMNIDVAPPEHPAIIRSLRQRVRRKELALQSIYRRVNPETLEKRFGYAGLTPENAWMYFRGHNLLDQVIMKLIKAIRSKMEARATQTYDNSRKRIFYDERQNIKQHLTDTLAFGQYPEIIWLEQDAKQFCKRYDNEKRRS
jgi:hypothetical protein